MITNVNYVQGIIYISSEGRERDNELLMEQLKGDQPNDYCYSCDNTSSSCICDKGSGEIYETFYHPDEGISGIEEYNKIRQIAILRSIS